MVKTQQWNFAIQRQLPLGVSLDAAYAGLRGANLPVSRGINPLPDSVLAQAATQCPPGSKWLLPQYSGGQPVLRADLPRRFEVSNRYPEPAIEAVPRSTEHRQQRKLHWHQQLPFAEMKLQKRMVEWWQ